MINHIFQLLDKPYHLDTETTRAAYSSGIVRGLIMGLCGVMIGWIIGEIIF